jgi:uncharacterized protein
MVKLGILSDTHLDKPTDNFRSIMETLFSDVDFIIHAGDMTGIEVHEYLSRWNLWAVRGNMDSQELRSILPEKRIEEIEGRSIGIIHGYGAPYGPESFVYNQFQGVDIIVFGHSHVPLHEVKGKTVIFNPGSLRKPHSPPGTVGIIEFNNGDVSFRHVDVSY